MRLLFSGKEEIPSTAEEYRIPLHFPRRVFYFPRENETRKSSEERIISLASSASEDWDHMRHCDEGLPYRESIKCNTSWITRNGDIDAYHIAARKVANKHARIAKPWVIFRPFSTRQMINMRGTNLLCSCAE